MKANLLVPFSISCKYVSHENSSKYSHAELQRNGLGGPRSIREFDKFAIKGANPHEDKCRYGKNGFEQGDRPDILKTQMRSKDG